MRRIEINNGCFLEIENTNRGVSVAHCDSMGYVKERETFDDAEIVMALNMLRYMRAQGSTCAYIMPHREEEGQRFFRNNIDHGDLAEFRIFQ